MCIHRSSGPTCRTSGLSSQLSIQSSFPLFPSPKPRVGDFACPAAPSPTDCGIPLPPPSAVHLAADVANLQPLFPTTLSHRLRTSLFRSHHGGQVSGLMPRLGNASPPATRSRSVPADGPECEWPGQRCLTPDVVFCSCLLLLSLMLLGVDPGGRGIRIVWCFGAVWPPPPTPDRPRGCESVPRGPWTFDLGGAAAPAALRRRSRREREARRD
jgi:hypothetical protein